MSLALENELARAKAASRRIPDARRGKALEIIVAHRIAVEAFDAGALPMWKAILLARTMREGLEALAAPAEVSP